jgi:hypothetical protein
MYAPSAIDSQTVSDWYYANCTGWRGIPCAVRARLDHSPNAHNEDSEHYPSAGHIRRQSSWRATTELAETEYAYDGVSPQLGELARELSPQIDQTTSNAAT